MLIRTSSQTRAPAARIARQTLEVARATPKKERARTNTTRAGRTSSPQSSHKNETSVPLGPSLQIRKVHRASTALGQIPRNPALKASTTVGRQRMASQAPARPLITRRPQALKIATPTPPYQITAPQLRNSSQRFPKSAAKPNGKNRNPNQSCELQFGKYASGGLASSRRLNGTAFRCAPCDATVTFPKPGARAMKAWTGRACNLKRTMILKGA